MTRWGTIAAVVATTVAGLLLQAGTAAAAITAPSGTVLTGVSVDGSLGMARELDAYTGSAGGHAPSIVMDYRDWAHNADFDTAFANSVVARGATPMITWEPWDYSAGPVQPNYRLSRISSGAHDSYIRRWATQIKAWNKPVLLRFGHEMNGSWYPWAAGVNGNTATDYVQVWRRVVSLFRQAGATNVTWVWSPNVAYPGQTATIASLYPGDAYVDRTALDGYNWGTTASSGWQSFEQVFGDSITQVRATARTKPLMLAEIGSAEQGGDKAAWIRDFFTRLAARPEISAFVWFNHDKEADWRIQSSVPARQAYAAGIGASRYR